MIRRLTVCDWQGRGKTDVVTQFPSRAEVEAAIRALNGENLNDIYITKDDPDSETYLCVGGGAGQYIVSGAIDNETFPTLINQERSASPKVELIVGGQIGEYPGNYIMDLEAAIEAARSFYDAAGFSETFGWINV